MVEECLVAVLLSASRDKEYHGCLCCAVFGQRQSAVEDKVSVPELHLFGLIREGAYGCLRTVDLRCSLLERQGKGESVLGIVAGDNVHSVNTLVRCIYGRDSDFEFTIVGIAFFGL